MSAYLIGNLIGRLIASYLVVWVVLFIATKFDWRLAFRRTHKWYGLLAIAALFLLGLAGVAKQGVAV